MISRAGKVYAIFLEGRLFLKVPRNRRLQRLRRRQMPQLVPTVVG